MNVLFSGQRVTHLDWGWQKSRIDGGHCAWCQRTRKVPAVTASIWQCCHSWLCPAHWGLAVGITWHCHGIFWPFPCRRQVKWCLCSASSSGLGHPTQDSRERALLGKATGSKWISSSVLKERQKLLGRAPQAGAGRAGGEGAGWQCSCRAGCVCWTLQLNPCRIQMHPFKAPSAGVLKD